MFHLLIVKTAAAVELAVIQYYAVHVHVLYMCCTFVYMYIILVHLVLNMH